MLRKYKPNGILRMTDRKMVSDEGFSGYDPSVPDRVKRNADGTVEITHVTYSEVEVELECGHFAKVWTTGYLGRDEYECSECEINKGETN